MAMRSCLHLVSAFILCGCAVVHSGQNTEVQAQAADTPKIHRDKARERELQANWSGKPYAALVQTYGAPKMIMNVPGYRPLKTSVAVFGVHDESSRCIDAFTVVKNGSTGEWTVADYFCR